MSKSDDNNQNNLDEYMKNLDKYLNNKDAERKDDLNDYIKKNFDKSYNSNDVKVTVPTKDQINSSDKLMKNFKSSKPDHSDEFPSINEVDKFPFVDPYDDDATKYVVQDANSKYVIDRLSEAYGVRSYSSLLNNANDYGFDDNDFAKFKYDDFKDVDDKTIYQNSYGPEDRFRGTYASGRINTSTGGSFGVSMVFVPEPSTPMTEEEMRIFMKGGGGFPLRYAQIMRDYGSTEEAVTAVGTALNENHMKCGDQAEKPISEDLFDEKNGGITVIFDSEGERIGRFVLARQRDLSLDWEEELRTNPDPPKNPPAAPAQVMLANEFVNEKQNIGEKGRMMPGPDGPIFVPDGPQILTNQRYTGRDKWLLDALNFDFSSASQKYTKHDKLMDQLRKQDAEDENNKVQKYLYEEDQYKGPQVE